VSSIGRLLRMRHYGKKSTLLKILSLVDFWVAVLLTPAPVYFPYLVRVVAFPAGVPIPPEFLSVVTSASRIVALFLSINGILRILKEFSLSKHAVVGREYRRDSIRQLITLLMDEYGWKGTCRVTIFLPRQENGNQTLRIYDRICAGEGPSEDGIEAPFFSKGQGIPVRKGMERRMVGRRSRILAPIFANRQCT
jgi:hypothetical protein